MPSVRKLIFDQAIRNAEILHQFFGDSCEVAVHDFSNLESSLIHLAGKLTGRGVGSPATDLVLKEFSKPSGEINDIPNYLTKSKNGLTMKSATSFLRDSKGSVIGALCINYDITGLSKMTAQMNDFINTSSPDSTTENFYSTVHEIIEEMIRSVIDDFNKPPHTLTLEEKVEVVRILEGKGAFLIRGSTDYLAMELGVSKFTIYNYLQRIRAQNEYQTN